MSRVTRKGNRHTVIASDQYKNSHSLPTLKKKSFEGRTNNAGIVVSRTQKTGMNAKVVRYLGPSIDGTDKEYVKVLTGDVDRKKPSFA